MSLTRNIILQNAERSFSDFTPAWDAQMRLRAFLKQRLPKLRIEWHRLHTYLCAARRGVNPLVNGKIVLMLVRTKKSLTRELTRLIGNQASDSRSTKMLNSKAPVHFVIWSFFFKRLYVNWWALNMRLLKMCLLRWLHDCCKPLMYTFVPASQICFLCRRIYYINDYINNIDKRTQFMYKPTTYN
jgi:hypothetical protein